MRGTDCVVWDFNPHLWFCPLRVKIREMYLPYLSWCLPRNYCFIIFNSVVCFNRTEHFSVVQVDLCLVCSTFCLLLYMYMYSCSNLSLKVCLLCIKYMTFSLYMVFLYLMLLDKNKLWSWILWEFLCSSVNEAYCIMKIEKVTSGSICWA